MFEGLKDMGKLLKQAGEMKSKMKTIQDELKRVSVTGSAEGGKIEVVLSGELECLDVRIDPSLASNVGALQKALVRAKWRAMNNVRTMFYPVFADII